MSKEIKFIFAVFLLLTIYSINATSQTTVNINENATGRTFEGIGVLSGGGGNSRLLKDYKEPYRSQILDYLFKPKFGASFKELKVEIGGDINSTSGAEPSHARTREENANPNMTRGYETWIIDEAKKRNPKITLYGLQWGAPSWISNMWSQDNADYLVSYLKGLKSVWGYDMDYIGGNQNESFNGTSTQARNYIVNILRPTLDNNGLSNVKIIAPDILSGDWALSNQLSSDAALKNAIYAIGYHYVGNSSTANAQNSGLPIWESEGWTGVGDWNGAYALAKLVNLNYIKGKMTKTDIWHLINSQYNNVNWPHSGIMEANTPWSGNYLVSPAVWAAAHTNQFAESGWKYLDSSCGETSNGSSYVTFLNPEKNKYSIVIVANETTDETITFNVSQGLSTSTIHVWKSNSTEQFIAQEDISVSGNSFTFRLSAGSIYSLTTTTGQQKGNAGTIPSLGSFASNYTEKFESYELGISPKYFYDLAGAFEVYEGTASKVLRQMITTKNWEWDVWGDYGRGNPFTEFGDLNWQNYDFSADVRIETSGSACIYGRLGKPMEGKNVSDFKGYSLSINNTGAWALGYGSGVLSSGTITNFEGNAWHHLQLSFVDENIKAYIDNVLKSSITDNQKSQGMAALGSDYSYVQFDNISVTSLCTTSKILSGGIYAIYNHNSNKALSPLNASTSSGANIVQVTYSQTPIQQWLFKDLGNGYWTIKNVGSGLFLDIKDASLLDGAYTVQNTYTGAKNQQWEITTSGCYYTILNRNSGKYLDISGGSWAENAQDIQWTANGGKNQQWDMVLLNQPLSPDSAKVISSNLSNNENWFEVQTSGTGTLYYVLRRKTDVPPSNSQEVLSDLNKGNTACLQNQVQSLVFTDLNPNTDYVLYMVVENKDVTGSISSFGFTTPPITAIVDNGLSTTLQLLPNPANDKVNISYVVDKKSYVKAEMFSSEGKKLFTLDNLTLDAGTYTQTLDISQLPSGIYFYRLRIGSKISTKKLIINH